jgi:hypothetical protein
MATGKSPEDPVPGARKRREPPTIDLTATEIPEPEMAKAPDTEPTVAQSAEPTAAPEAEGVRFRFAPEEQTTSTEEAAPPPASPPDRPRASAWPPSAASVGIFASGAGAALMVFLLLVWIVGPFRSRDDAAIAMMTNARLAQMEIQLRDLAGRPAPASLDPKQLDALSSRLAQLESSLSTRLATAEGAARSAGDTAKAASDAAKTATDTGKAASDTAALANRRIDETAALAREARSQADAAASTASRNNPESARADLEALANRIAAVEKNATAAEAELAKRVAAPPDDRAGRLAVAALSLRGTVERGDPFTTELVAAKALGADPKTLAALEPYAAAGLPSPSSLSRELGKIAPQMQRAAGTTAENGFIEKLQANAERLVRIRPIEDVPGDDPATVIGRIEIKTAQNDIAGALAELRKLPAPVRAPAEDWARRAEGRNAALESAKSFAATALAALGKAGS